MLSRTLLVWLAITQLTACGTDRVPHTQVTVHVLFARVAVEDGDNVRIRVWRGRYEELVRDCFVDARSLFGPTDQVDLQVPVIPNDNRSPTEMTIVAELYRSTGTPLAVQRAIVEYVRDTVVHIDLPFAGGCGDIVCSDYETCSDSVCESACFNRVGDVLERGPCEVRGDPLESCSRGSANAAGTESQSESWCPRDGFCFCRDPEGCLLPDEASCCHRPLLCDPPNACLISAVIPGATPRCPADGVLCPDGDRCVEPGRVDTCCGGGISTCFGM